jgi:hypothetical protein
MIQKLVILFVFVCNLSYAQSSWQSFVPKGQKVDTVTRGDLNKDGIDDIVFVSQTEENPGEHSTDRTLNILLGQADGTYKQSAVSRGAVAGKNEYGYVFFSGVEIKKGVLIVEHEYLRGGCTHIYRYQNGGFYLIGASTHNGDPSQNSSIEYNMSTGNYVSEYINYDDEKLSRTVKGKLKPASLPRIEDYELFTIEVASQRL